ncbi:MAG: heavy metal translocating P-type ATPase [Ardenticatenia bacterium]|nr:heavy metal translocating P-type ATPase [Ardenticatenia bacterium]
MTVTATREQQSVQVGGDTGVPLDVNRYEALLTAVCALSLGTAWVGGRVGMIPSQAELALYVLAYISGGFFGAWEGLRALRHFELNIDFLMVVAALGAATVGEWVEGGILLFLFSLSNTLQGYALGRSRQAIRALMDLRPAEALVRRDGHEERVPVEALVVGDVVIVKPGERIPVDGQVIRGTTAVDQSTITGESMPVTKGPGDSVFAGTLNTTGVIEVEATRSPTDTTLAKIIQMVEEAQTRKAPTQRFLEAFEPKYAAGVILAVLIFLGISVWVLGQPFDDAFYRAMTLLVVASPCALVISTPAAILSAIANAARRGILFKGGAFLEQAATLEAMAFDKTGTLTVGKPRVTDVVPAAEVLGEAWFAPELAAELQPKGFDVPDRCTRDDLLAVAASAERYSEHPLAAAIVQAAQEAGVSLYEATETQAVPGHGVCAQVNGEEIRIGNRRFFETARQIWPMPLLALARRMEQEGKTVVFVSRGNRPLGLIALADIIRPEAAPALADLRRLGIRRIVMVTGDARQVAEAVARRLDILEVYAELLPQQKVEIVEKLAAQSPVAVVGDGVNDAPAMAVSHVGIAMGAAGTDVALETADIVLMADDLSRLPHLVRLARRARRIVWQNIAFSLAVIVVLIVSVFLFELPLPLGVVGHEGSTLVVVANGLRLLRAAPPAS